MELTITVVTFILAAVLGGWRQMCGAIELKDPGDLPRMWYTAGPIIVTWWIVAILSVTCAYLIFKSAGGGVYGGGLFYVALIARYYASIAIATFLLARYSPRIFD